MHQTHIVQMTSSSSSGNSSSSTYFFNQIHVQNNNRQTELQELIFYFFQQNNLLNQEQLGHPIYTLQEAKDLLKDKTVNFAADDSSSVNALTSKLYQFVVANMNNDEWVDRNGTRAMDYNDVAVVDMDGSGMSGDGSGSGDDSQDGSGALVRGPRRHHYLTDLLDRNRPLIMEHDDFLPNIHVNDEDFAEVDRYFSNQMKRGHQNFQQREMAHRVRALLSLIFFIKFEDSKLITDAYFMLNILLRIRPGGIRIWLRRRGKARIFSDDL